jgi:hypothetical protein
MIETLARVTTWEIQKRLGFRCPVAGFGRLVREMP